MSLAAIKRSLLFVAILAFACGPGHRRVIVGRAGTAGVVDHLRDISASLPHFRFVVEGPQAIAAQCDLKAGPQRLENVLDEICRQTHLKWTYRRFEPFSDRFTIIIAAEGERHSKTLIGIQNGAMARHEQ